MGYWIIQLRFIQIPTNFVVGIPAGQAGVRLDDFNASSTIKIIVSLT